LIRDIVILYQFSRYSTACDSGSYCLTYGLYIDDRADWMRTRALGEAMDVDSSAPPVKWHRQATLSFRIEGWGGGAA